MVKGGLLGLHTVLLGYVVWLHPRLWVMVLAALALGTAGAGLMQRWPGGLFSAALLSTAAYLGALYAGQSPPDLVGALLWGFGLFIWIQLGYDHTTLSRLPWSAAAHRRRLRTLLGSVGFSLGLALLLVVWTGMFSLLLPVSLRGWLGLLGVVGGVGAIVVGIRLWGREAENNSAT